MQRHSDLLDTDTESDTETESDIGAESTAAYFLSLKTTSRHYPPIFMRP